MMNERALNECGVNASFTFMLMNANERRLSLSQHSRVKKKTKNDNNKTLEENKLVIVHLLLDLSLYLFRTHGLFSINNIFVSD